MDMCAHVGINPGRQLVTVLVQSCLHYGGHMACIAFLIRSQGAQSSLSGPVRGEFEDLGSCLLLERNEVQAKSFPKIGQPSVSPLSRAKSMIFALHKPVGFWAGLRRSALCPRIWWLSHSHRFDFKASAFGLSAALVDFDQNFDSAPVSLCQRWRMLELCKVHHSLPVLVNAPRTVHSFISFGPTHPSHEKPSPRWSFLAAAGRRVHQRSKTFGVTR